MNTPESGKRSGKRTLKRKSDKKILKASKTSWTLVLRIDCVLSIQLIPYLWDTAYSVYSESIGELSECNTM